MNHNDPHLLIVDDDRRIVIEAKIRAVSSADRRLCTDDDSANHLALLDDAVGRCFLDGGRHNVANGSVSFPLSDHPDGDDPFGAAVIADIKACFGLYHEQMRSVWRIGTSEWWTIIWYVSSSSVPSSQCAIITVCRSPVTSSAGRLPATASASACSTAASP